MAYHQSSSVAGSPSEICLQTHTNEEIDDGKDTPRSSIKSAFFVDTSLIKTTTLVEQQEDVANPVAKSGAEPISLHAVDTDELNNLGLDVYNQNELEEGIMAQVDEAMAREEEARIRNIALRELKSVEDDLRSTEEELKNLETIIASYDGKKTLSNDTKPHLRAVHSQKQNKLKQHKTLTARRKKLQAQLVTLSYPTESSNNLSESSVNILTKPSAETQTEKLIRLGEMTPFGSTVTPIYQENQATVPSTSKEMTDFESFLAGHDDVKPIKSATVKHKRTSDNSSSVTPCKKIRPAPSVGKKCKISALNIHKSDIAKKRDPHRMFGKKVKQNQVKLKKPLLPHFHTKTVKGTRESRRAVDNDDENGVHDDEDYVPEDSSSEEEYIETTKNISPRPSKTKKHLKMAALNRDDGNAALYEKRIKKHKYEELLRASSGDTRGEDAQFAGGLRVPSDTWNKLYRYQQTCVKWLWELHCQEAGGIVGDEMGLGKTIQLIVFLGALRHSRLPSRTFGWVGLGPCLIVCPATVMMQWVREFHKWEPMFRVAVLHSSGSYVTSEASLIQNIVNGRGVLVTSYTSLVIHQTSLLKHAWHYVVLDEGHKIRNPDAQITLSCKQFRTPHRLILSGSPIQNNLKELWSLIDFVFPGKLGTLPDFMQHFAVPITQGGYSNATQVQVQTAYKCACVLRDTINPYLLRRLKADVKLSLQLPNKNEQVLFCRLSDEQRDIYQQYLDSDECKAILNGKFKIFVGLTTLRKICNHPDISSGGPRILVGDTIPDDDDDTSDPTLQYGYYRRSGKMIVIESLLKIWRRQGHRVLLFSQSKAMLNILESFVRDAGYTYMRMDGSTNISSRQALINKYNNDPEIFVFLLTTRVGGLGVNLTGANRVVIYDPDWNPSTDLQARERSWRIGQTQQVTIYRLLTKGTIEEKIYHRQIFKQFLTNRVLHDPKQRRFFKSNDLMELFTLGSRHGAARSETSAIFAGTGSDVTVPRKVGRSKARRDADLNEKSERIRRLARRLSAKIGRGTYTAGDDGQDHKKTDGWARKDKKSRNAKFEGVDVPNLVKQRVYNANVDEGGDGEKVKNKKQDDYVLQRLFAKTGVEEAIQHDTIINSANADFALVEAEADRVARQAASALKRSRAHCNPAVSGIPTWTGVSATKPRFGQKKNTKLAGFRVAKDNSTKSQNEVASAPPKLFDGHQAGSHDLYEQMKPSPSSSSSAPSAAPSSHDLLARMRARNNLSSDADVSSTQAASHDDANFRNSAEFRLISDIRDHIACRCQVDGQATTSEILAEFSTLLPPSDNAKFKAMLNEICTFEKDSDDVGVWKLRPQFR